MDCPDTHKDVIAQLCGLHYYPGVGCSCASAATCNHHFQRWLKGEPEVKKLHQEYLAQKRGTAMIDQDKPTDFHISVKPVSIEFECPHCHEEVEIRWSDLLVPEYWGDDWGEVDCPECEKSVRLGDYDYD